MNLVLCIYLKYNLLLKFVLFYIINVFIIGMDIFVILFVVVMIICFVFEYGFI